RRHYAGGIVGERRELPEPRRGIASTRDELGATLAVACFQGALDFALRGLARDRIAFVVRVLALGESQFNLGAAVFEIEFQRDDRIALLAHAAPQAIDLAAMHQEFSRAGFLVAELSRGSVGADVNALEERFAVFDAGVAVSEICAMRTQRLDLGAGECEAGLEGLLDEEVVPRLAVVGHQIKSVARRFAVAGVACHRRASLSAGEDADKGGEAHGCEGCDGALHWRCNRFDWPCMESPLSVGANWIRRRQYGHGRTPGAVDPQNWQTAKFTRRQ